MRTDRVEGLVERDDDVLDGLLNVDRVLEERLGDRVIDREGVLGLDRIIELDEELEERVREIELEGRDGVGRLIDREAELDGRVREAELVERDGVGRLTDRLGGAVRRWGVAVRVVVLWLKACLRLAPLIESQHSKYPVNTITTTCTLLVVLFVHITVPL